MMRRTFSAIFLDQIFLIGPPWAPPAFFFFYKLSRKYFFFFSKISRNSTISSGRIVESFSLWRKKVTKNRTKRRIITSIFSTQHSNTVLLTCVLRLFSSILPCLFIMFLFSYIFNQSGRLWQAAGCRDLTLSSIHHFPWSGNIHQLHPIAMRYEVILHFNCFLSTHPIICWIFEVKFSKTLAI